MQNESSTSSTPSFVPGLELSRRFYEELVQPIMREAFPNLPYAAALIGQGSEVLGFDTPQSRDHDWGARLFIFLREADAQHGDEISNLLSHLLPPRYLDAPVHFDQIPSEPRTRIMLRPVTGPVRHRVIPITLRNFTRIQAGCDLTQPLSVADWLTIPSSVLGGLIAGAVYHDSVGEVTALRHQFAWYPHDIWLYLLASGWQRIGEEEHLMPRAGDTGDELGSAIIGSRLIRDVIRQCFLLERQYAPYAKWLGTAFMRLRSAPEMAPLLQQAQQATTWREREAALARAYELLAHLQNALGVANPVLPETVSHFYDRPYLVIHGARFAEALRQQIRDPEVQRLASRHLIGNIDQWNDNVGLLGLEHAQLRRVYEDEQDGEADKASETKG
jgi:hypothetical protein